MPRLKARRFREAAAAAGRALSADQIHALVLIETGDPEAAARAMTDHVAALLRAGHRPE